LVAQPAVEVIEGTAEIGCREREDRARKRKAWVTTGPPGLISRGLPLIDEHL
jgi:hypothetical protein